MLRAPWSGYGLILILAAGLAACGEHKTEPAAGAAAPPPAVTVVKVERREINPSETFTGRIEAVDKVDLIARVQGFLEQRLFEEGKEVEQGDPLFVIEKGPYEATVAEIQASIVSAQASLKEATLERQRQETLVQKNVATQQQLDQALAKQDESRGELMRQQAALEKAQLDLSYTDIKAPITGKIGRATYTAGNFVGPSSGTLATLVSQDPMYVTFPVTQRKLLEVRKEAQEKGQDPRNVTVQVRLANDTLYDQTGSINFVDVQVNPNTDTVQVRAALPNPGRQLIDGQLVTVIVATATPEAALMIPQQAIQIDQAGAFVLVVGQDDKVEARRIGTGPSQEGLVAVTQGLSEGERVITEGIQKVRPGQVVAPAEASSSATARG